MIEPMRRFALLLAAVAVLASCTSTVREQPPSASSSVSVSSSPRRALLTGSAARLLATVEVKGRAPRTGYDRDEFGSAWTDDNMSPLGHNGCDTRNDILRRDLRGIALKPGSNGCAVLSGTLRDPYTTRTISFVRGPQSADVQIDHVVALSDAWQKGAFRWSVPTRTAFANDPLNLLAVDGPTNSAKGDGDAATWLPPNKAYRCAYVARQVAVKARYQLWVTSAERDAISRVLATCPGRPAPSETPAVGVSPEPSGPSVPPACTTTRSGNCIEGGQLCPHASYGRRGSDASGQTYVCRGDRQRPRWELP